MSGRMDTKNAHEPILIGAIRPNSVINVLRINMSRLLLNLKPISLLFRLYVLTQATFMWLAHMATAYRNNYKTNIWRAHSIPI